MKQLQEVLRDDSLVIFRNEIEVKRFSRQGIVDLLEIITTCPEILDNSEVYDKVVGKAAAIIFTKHNVKKINSVVMSSVAVDFLTKHNIEHSYIKSPKYILNRTKDDLCPIEKSVDEVDDYEVALEKIHAKLAELRKG